MTQLKPKRLKYGNTPTIVDGIRFDSKAEAKRYSELKLLEREKLIHTLELQPLFPLNYVHPETGKNSRICTYRADFSYFNLRENAWIVEDVKGGKATQTDAFKIKWAFAKAQYAGQFTFKIIGG